MICPFCKEEIQDGAIKCKHCNSMLNGSQFHQTVNHSNYQQQAPSISNIDVSEIWKDRFKTFHEYGSQPTRPWWLLGGYYFNSKDKKLAWRGLAVYNKDNYISMTAVLFGGFWYLVKGMWKKGLLLLGVELLINIIVVNILGITDVPEWLFGTAAVAGIASASASYDYYRFKVLNQTFWW